MDGKKIAGVVLLTLLTSFVLSLGWELTLEERVFAWAGLTYDEAFEHEERWVFAGTSAIFAVLSLAAPALVMLHTFKRLHTQQAEAAAVRESLRAREKLAKLGSWRLPVGTGIIEGSEGIYRIFGGDHGKGAVPVDAVLSAIRPSDRAMITEFLSPASDRTYSAQFTIRRPDGQDRICWAERRAERDSSGRIIAVGGVVQDVTDRENAAAQLRQAQKMESVGQLTGGLAHDFNNLLTIVIGNLEIIEGAPEETEAVRDSASAAMLAALKGGQLTQQLLAFSRRQTLAPERLDLNELVEEMRALWTRTLGESIVTEFKGDRTLWSTTADPSQVQTALLNLVLNARDAMPSGGVLRVETCNVSPGEAEARGEFAPGDYCMISVSDTGSGIEPELLGQVFEPFFTTKPVGEGSGLGLSMVYGFAKQSGGHVTIDSVKGQGSTVRLYLPRTAPEAPGSVAAAPAAAPPVAAEETVLVVEDNAEVRSLAVRMIRDLGYQALEAQDGPEAFELLDLFPEIDLVFTDLVMPGGVNGIELVQRAQKRRPDLKALYTTGFSDAARANAHAFAGGDLLVPKPYRRAALAAKLREALDA